MPTSSPRVRLEVESRVVDKLLTRNERIKCVPVDCHDSSLGLTVENVDNCSILAADVKGESSDKWKRKGVQYRFRR